MKLAKKLALLAGSALLVLALASCPSGDPVPPVELVPLADMPRLFEVYADYFPIGNIIANRHRNDFTNSRRIDLLRHHFNLLTAENEMKPNEVRTGSAYPGNWNFGSADALITWAGNNGFDFHGHTLAWHSQSPRWLAQTSNAADAETRLRYHIRYVMNHFGNRVESWDVLNEVIMSGGPGAGDLDMDDNPLNLDGFHLYTETPGMTVPPTAANPATTFPWEDPSWNWRRALRAHTIPDHPSYTNWPAAINARTNNASCFVRIAFEEARDVKPGLIRYYNDYNLNIPRKRFAVYRMVRDINNLAFGSSPPPPEELLIQAIGMQAHYWLPGVTLPNAPGTRPAWVHPRDVRDSMVRFASLGVYVSITELDIFAGAGREMDQAVMYARLFNLFRQFALERRFDANTLDDRSVLRRVSIWGVDDPASWMPVRTPLLFDARGNPKMAFWAVANPREFLAENAPEYLTEFDADCFRCFNLPRTCDVTLIRPPPPAGGGE